MEIETTEMGPTPAEAEPPFVTPTQPFPAIFTAAQRPVLPRNRPAKPRQITPYPPPSLKNAHFSDAFPAHSTIQPTNKSMTYNITANTDPLSK
jgi:hypothetical protein